MVGACQHKVLNLGTELKDSFSDHLTILTTPYKLNEANMSVSLSKPSVPAECLVVAHEDILSPCVREEM